MAKSQRQNWQVRPHREDRRPGIDFIILAAANRAVSDGVKEHVVRNQIRRTEPEVLDHLVMKIEPP